MNFHDQYYLPSRQDLIWIDFKPSVGKEIRGRHPALVLSSHEYSILTGLTMVMPITHAENNRLRDFFIPLHAKKLTGFINPLQTYTFSCRNRRSQFVEIAADQDWADALIIHRQIIE